MFKPNKIAIAQTIETVTEKNWFKFLFFFAIIFSSVFKYQFIYNEDDVLPTIFHQTDTNWLSHDWYLQLEIGYRLVFNYLTGGIVNTFGFQIGAYITRAISYAIFTLAYISLVNTLKIRWFFASVALLFFSNFQSLAFDEWILGGVETKAFSYSCVIFSISYVLKSRYKAALFFSGLAMTFHVLIGIYNAFALFTLVLTIKEHRKNILSLLKDSWIFFLSGANGIIFALQQLTGKNSPIIREDIWEYYVNFRVPHHLLPEYWLNSSSTWIMYASVFAVILSLFNKQRDEKKQFIFLLLPSYILIISGFCLYWFGETAALRVFVFRYPDTIIPFITFLVIGPLCAELLKQKLDFGNYKAPLLFVSTLCLFVALAYLSYKKYHDIRWTMYKQVSSQKKAKNDIYQAIETYTKHDDLILVPLGFSEIYIKSNRAPLVTFKHLPQSASDLELWVRKLESVYGNIDPSIHKGFQSFSNLNATYYKLNYRKIESIKDDNLNLNYLVTKTEHKLPYIKIYENNSYVLYSLSETNSP